MAFERALTYLEQRGYGDRVRTSRILVSRLPIGNPPHRHGSGMTEGSENPTHTQ